MLHPNASRCCFYRSACPCRPASLGSGDHSGLTWTALSRCILAQAHPGPCCERPLLPWGSSDTEVWGPVGTVQHSGGLQGQQLGESSHSARHLLTREASGPGDRCSPCLPEARPVRLLRKCGFLPAATGKPVFCCCSLRPRAGAGAPSALPGIAILNRSGPQSPFVPGCAFRGSQGKTF